MNTEIINQIIEMLKTGASYSEIQNKLGLYPVQIKRIKDKFININNNTNVSTNDKNSNTNSKNNNTNVSVNKEKELELKLQQVKFELENLKEHNYELQTEKLKMQLKQETETDEPKLEDAVYWKNKNVEGGIVSIKLGDNENEPNIAEVEFDNEEVIEIPFNKLIDDNGKRWLFENEIKTHHQRMLELERKGRERKRKHEEFMRRLKR